MGILDRLKELIASEEVAVPTLHFAAGETTRVEIARSGEFTDMSGQKVALTPQHLASLAQSFDAEKEHLVKLGHERITTKDPLHGTVTNLAYDPEKDRLFADVVPTELLVEKNRKGGYPRCSMELGYNKAKDEYRFDHLALLGARRPAISGLAPVALASDDGEERTVMVAAADPDEKPEEMKVTAASPEQPLEGSRQTKTELTKETQMAEEAVALAEEQKRSARLSERIKKAAEERVDAFLERHKDKIPMSLHKKGIKEVLTHFAIKDGDDGSTVNLALPGETAPTERSEYSLVAAMLAELPPMLAETEKKELTKSGLEVSSETSTLPPILASMSADPEGDAYLTATLAEQAEAKAKGETLDFAEAARRIYAKRGDRG
jgi:hypothetical protein